MRQRKLLIFSFFQLSLCFGHVLNNIHMHFLISRTYNMSFLNAFRSHNSSDNHL